MRCICSLVRIHGACATALDLRLVLVQKTAECDSLQKSFVGFLSWILTSREMFAGENNFTDCGETPKLIEHLVVLSSASTQYVALERQITPTRILYEGWYSQKAQDHELRDCAINTTTPRATQFIKSRHDTK